MNTELSAEFREIVKNRISSLCTRMDLNWQYVADVHNVIYRCQNDAFVIDIRQNLPQKSEIKKILEQKLRMNLDKFFEVNFEDFVSKTIKSKIEALSNELGVKIKVYGGFIGISVRVVDNSRMTADYDHIINEYTNMFLSYIEETESFDLQEFEQDNIYSNVVLSEFLRKNIEYYYKYVNSPILQTFRERVEAMVSTEFTLESWIEKFESAIETHVFLPPKQFSKFEDLLEMTQYFEMTGQVAQFNEFINRLKAVEERTSRGVTISYYRILAIFRTYWNVILEPKNTSASAFSRTEVPPEAKEILIEFIQSLKK